MIAPSSKLLLSAVSLFASLVVAAPRQARSVDTPYTTASSQSIELKVLRNYGDISSSSARRLRARTNAEMYASNNSLPLRALSVIYSAPVTIDDQAFNLEIDTGSSDTWVADSFFNCFSTWGYRLPQSYCEVANTLDRKKLDSSSSFLDDYHFAVSYADGSGASGPMMLTLVSLTPKVTTVQSIGVASNVGWRGRNMTSGILGLGLSSLTSGYSGTDSTQDVPCPLNGSTTGYNIHGAVVPCNQIQYKSLIDNLRTVGSWDNGTSKSEVPGEYFSMALSRDKSDSGNGGSLTFSGIPDIYDAKVNASLPFAVVPIESLPSTGSNRSDYYTISVDGFFFPAYTNFSVSTPSYNHTTSLTDRATINTNKLNFRRSATTFHSSSNAGNGKSQFIVDSGSTLSYLPAELSQSFNSLFHPAAYLDYNISQAGLWRVDCSTIHYIPTLGISIGGMTLSHNPEDLVFRTMIEVYDRHTGDYVMQEACYSAIQDVEFDLGNESDGSVVGTLGQPFLKNVLAVFDVGRNVMGFAARPEYDS